MHVRPTRFAAVLIASAAVGGLLAGCGSSSHAAPAATPTASPSPTATSASPSPLPAAMSPLTGRPGPTSCPVLAVKVDNTAPARPQVGVDSADVVYVEQVEGGLSRIMAVFCSKLPDIVGPARSARLNDLELLREYGHVGLAYSGANRGVVAAVQAAPVVSMNEDSSSAFFRGLGRYAPYNLFVRAPQAVKTKGIARVRDVGFRFGEPSLGVGARLASSVSVHYPVAWISFTWDAASHRWLESVDGVAGVAADGKRIAADNVVVQYVRVGQDRFVDVRGNPTPYSSTIGSGGFTLLRDGHVYTGIWRRPTATSPTTWLDATGRHKLAFKPGQTWVILLSRTSRASVS